MLVELQTSEANLPRTLSVEYVGQTEDGYDAAIIDGVWSALETVDGSLQLTLLDGTEYTLTDTSLLKAGDAAGALDIPGEEVAPMGTVQAETNEYKALRALRAYGRETGESYATPSQAVPYATIDEAAMRNAFAVLFGLKNLLNRHPVGSGSGGVQFAFGLKPEAETLVDELETR